jgi:6-phosphogluconolactonase
MTRMKRLALLGALAIVPVWGQVAYIGTYTKPGGSKGIYRVQLNSATGMLSEPELAAESENPSFLAIAKGGKFLYAVNEVRDGDVSAFAVEASGKLRLLNKVKAKGDAPCHLNLDRSGKWLAVANYSSGTAAVLPVKPDGSLGEAVAVVQHKGKSVNPQRQQGPHAHSVNFSEDNQHLFVADLGLDEVKIYSFDAKTGAIAEKARLVAPQGGGPRHLAIGKGGLVYVLNEMGSSVSVFRWKGEAKVEALKTVSSLPAGMKDDRNSGAEVVLHPSGKLLISSNRGYDSLAIFRPDGAGGLEPLGQQTLGGKVPRGFVLSPDGKFVVAGGQNSDQLFSFRVDLADGKLIPLGSPVKVGSPVCVRFVR